MTTRKAINQAIINNDIKSSLELIDTMIAFSDTPELQEICLICEEQEISGIQYIDKTGMVI